MGQGVDLTPGQMNPESMLGQIEEVSTNLPFVGPAIKKARENAVGDWQKAVTKQAGAPGAAPANVDAAYQSFGPAYDQAKGFPTAPRIMRTAGGDTPLADFPQSKGAFTQAARDPNVFADKQQRKTVEAWLQNKLTALPGAGRSAGTVDSAALLKLRSEIRDQIRTLANGKNPDEASAALLRNAERSVTDALESQLPKSATDALRATDKQYGQYKIVEDAARRAGDQTQGMTPSQLSAAVKAATPAGPYARGEGGPLRKLASSGKQVFDARTPPTGARLAALAPIAYVAGAGPSAVAAGALALAATNKYGRKAIGGGFKAQQKGAALQRALRRKAGRVINNLGIATGARAGEAQTDQE
jgi:hypothetical protein